MTSPVDRIAAVLREHRNAEYTHCDRFRSRDLLACTLCEEGFRNPDEHSDRVAKKVAAALADDDYVLAERRTLVERQDRARRSMLDELTSLNESRYYMGVVDGIRDVLAPDLLIGRWEPTQGGEK